MNREIFAKAMFILFAAYERELSQDTLEVYYKFLNHLTPDQLERAARRHIARSSYFPKINELLQAIQEDAPSPIDLWNKLIAAAEANEEKPELDPAAERALEFIGGWDKFRITPYEDLKFRFRDFKAALLEGREKEARCDILIDMVRHPQLEEG